VVGAGSWGTTIATLVSQNTATSLWTRRTELAEEINTKHLNSAYLGNYILPVGLEASVDLEQLVKHADVVAMAVPSQGFRHIAQQVAKYVAVGVPIMSLSKGLESETLLRMSEVLASEMPNNPRAVLSGPVAQVFNLCALPRSTGFQPVPRVAPA
jgi:glycerol-3-phosphate dehydrogenase (NAD(P)+)